MALSDPIFRYPERDELHVPWQVYGYFFSILRTRNVKKENKENHGVLETRWSHEKAIFSQLGNV